MIELRLFANLPELARSRRRRVEVTFRPGLTAGEVMTAERDRLSFFPVLGGG